MKIFQIEQSTLFTLLKQRCKYHQCKLSFANNYFEIIQCNTGKTIVFSKKREKDECCVEVLNDHLYGLYDPNILFKIFDCFKNLQKQTNLCFSIFNDELVLSQQSVAKWEDNDIFRNIFQKFNVLDKSMNKKGCKKQFKIQLNEEGYLIINRCLKLSPFIAKILLSLDLDNHIATDRSAACQTLELVVDLAVLYFQCFEKFPVCPVMQSISSDAIVYDFYLYSHIYLQTYKAHFQNLIELLFPFIKDITDINYLEKTFFEVLPVKLIILFHQKPCSQLLNITREALLGLVKTLVLPSNARFDFTELIDSYVPSINRVLFEEKDKDLKEKIITIVEEIENKEGICLFIQKKWIGILGRSFGTHEMLTDYSFHTKDELEKFFEKISQLSKENLKGIAFQITNIGFIVFNNYCKIWPATFNKINDILLLLNLIRDISHKFTGRAAVEKRLNYLKEKKEKTEEEKCELYKCKGKLQNILNNRFLSVCGEFISEYVEYSQPLTKTRNTYAESKVFLIKAAKLFNPILESLPDKLFHLQRFYCAPLEFCGIKASSQSIFIYSLEQIRRNKLSLTATAKTYYVNVNNFECDIVFLHCMGEQIHKFMQFLKDIELLKADFDFATTLKTTGFASFELVKINDPLVPSKFNKNDNISELLEKCATILNTCKKKASIYNNTCLSFDWFLLIECDIFAKIKRDNLPIFFNIVKLHSEMQSFAGRKRFPNWISINELSNSELRKNFQEIAEVLNPYLKNFKNESILCAFKILPQNLLPYIGLVNSNVIQAFRNTGENWEVYVSRRLLDILRKITEDYNLHVSINSLGFLSIDNSFTLPVSKWVQIKNTDKFVDLRNIINTTDSLPGYYLHHTGCLSEINSQEVPFFMKVDRETFQILVRNLIEKLACSMLPLIVDSFGNIMIGNFIYIKPFTSITHLLQIINAVNNYEESVLERNLELLNSLTRLNDVENAIIAVKLFNDVLEKVPHSILNNDALKIFPKALFEAWQENSDATFQKLKSVFNQFEKLKLSWRLNFNGHIIVGDYVTITFKHILNIKNIEKFKDLVMIVQDSNIKYLICEEELRYARNIEEKLSREVKDPKDVFNAKKSHDFNIRVEPNLMLLVQKSLWVHPEDFFQNVRERVDAIYKVSEGIKESFDVSQNFRFGFGYSKDGIFNSIFQHLRDTENDYAKYLKVYLNDEVRYEIDEETQKFVINDSLQIHPRTFFHLQNVPEVIEILKKIRPSDSNILHANFLKDMCNVSNNNKLEFNQIRKLCLIKIGKLFYDKIDIVQTFLPSANLSSEKYMYGIENLEVQGVKCFNDGVSYILLNNELELRFNEEVFILALGFASYLDDNNKCLNVPDFNSVLESVYEYCQGVEIDKSGKLTRKKKNEKPKSESEEEYKIESEPISNDNCRAKLKTMTEFLAAQMTTLKDLRQVHRYFYKTELKALHHWLKHGYDFNNAKHYYAEMNNFFKVNKECFSEFDTANGVVILQNYKSLSYKGSIAYSPDGNKESYVTTFRYCIESKFLVFTDFHFTFKSKILKTQLKTDDPIKFLYDKKLCQLKPQSIEEVTKLLFIFNNKDHFKDNFHKLRMKFPRADIAACINTKPVNINCLCFAALHEKLNGRSSSNFQPSYLTNLCDNYQSILFFTSQLQKLEKNAIINVVNNHNFNQVIQTLTELSEDESKKIENILLMVDETIKNEMQDHTIEEFCIHFKSFLMLIIEKFKKSAIVICLQEKTIDKQTQCNIEKILRDDLDECIFKRIVLISITPENICENSIVILK